MNRLAFPGAPRFAVPPGRTPRAALVHDWLTGMRGGEKVLEALADLLPEAPIYTLFHLPGSVSPKLEARSIRTSFLQKAPGLARHYRRYLPLFPVAIEELDLSGFDLVVSSSHCAAKGIIPPPDAFHICYCHTPMRYAWDQEHAYFPKRTGVASHARSLALTALRSWDVASAARVHLFVANSRFVASRIASYYDREAEVVPPPVEVEFFTPEGAKGGGPGGPAKGTQGGKKGSRKAAPETAAPAGDFALMVSALAPYKKVDLAIAACDRLGLPLAIVGEGPERSRLEELAGPKTRFLGRVAGEALRDLYRRARFFLQPGVEDFGIASVEALACGTPVVAVGRGGILDIVEDGVHGLLYPDWGGPADLADAIDKAMKIGFNPLDLRSRAEHFSGAHFSERMRSLFSRRPKRARGLPLSPSNDPSMIRP